MLIWEAMVDLELLAMTLVEVVAELAIARVKVGRRSPGRIRGMVNIARVINSNLDATLMYGSVYIEHPRHVVPGQNVYTNIT